MRLDASEIARERSYFELMQLKQEIYSLKSIMELASEASSQSPALSDTLASVGVLHQHIGIKTLSILVRIPYFILLLL